MADRDRVALLVLIEVANHADPMGWCYPGVQKVAQTTGYSIDNVLSGIDTLMGKDWLRMHIVKNERRNRVEKDFMLSSNALYIRPELEVEQCKQYNALPYHPTYASALAAAGVVDDRPSVVIRPAQAVVGHTVINNPLDPQDEEVAVRVYERMRGTLSLVNARKFILEYGRDAVDRASVVAVTAAHVKNPVGKMLHDLKLGLADVAPTPTNKYTAGSDASFIQT